MPFGFKYMIIPNKKESISSMRRKIFVYNDKYELIEQFNMVTDAAIKYKVQRKDISKSIRNMYKLKGFYFSYDYPFKEPKCVF